MLSYHAKALRVADGLPYGERNRAPLYPHLVGWVYRAVGVHATAVYALQSVLEAGAIALLAAAVARRFGGRAGLAAGLFGALYPSRFFYSSLLLSENLSVILICSFAAALLFFEERPSSARAWIAGSLGGLAFLTRPVLCLTVAGAVVAASALPVAGRYRLWLSAVALSGALGVAAPWIWLTRFETGHLVFGDLAAGGVSIWIGNNPDATGRFFLPPAFGRFHFADPYQANAGLSREAIRYALSHPLRTVLLWGPKSSYWWSPEHRELMYLYSNGWIPSISPAALWLVYGLVGLGFTLLVPFALRGALLVSTPALAGCLAAAGSIWVLNLLSFGDSRFHVPALPLLWVFAGIGAVVAGPLRPGRRLAGAVLGLLFLANAAYDLTTSASTVARLAQPDGTRTRMSYGLWR